MSLVFQRGSTLVLEVGGVFRRFLVSSATINQTYQEERRSVRTIHNNTQIEDTSTNSKTNASLEFSLNLTKDDGILFQWFGMLESASKKYSIIPNRNPLQANIYLETTTSLYKVDNVYPRTISLVMAKDGPIRVNVSATGSDWKEITYTNIPANTQMADSFFIGGISGINNLAGVTLELTRDITWVNTKTVHDAVSGNIYTNNKMYSENYSVSGTITKYKRDNSLSHSLDGLVNFTYANGFLVNLEPCKLLDRWSTDEVHRKMTDYMLLPNTTNSFIQFV